MLSRPEAVFFVLLFYINCDVILFLKTKNMFFLIDFILLSEELLFVIVGLHSLSCQQN